MQSQSSIVRSLSQIASELCRSVQSLSSASSLSNISRSNSSASLPTIVIEGIVSISYIEIISDFFKIRHKNLTSSQNQETFQGSFTFFFLFKKKL